jgi:hypothetical protein
MPVSYPTNAALAGRLFAEANVTSQQALTPTSFRTEVQSISFIGLLHKSTNQKLVFRILAATSRCHRGYRGTLPDLTPRHQSDATRSEFEVLL